MVASLRRQLGEMEKNVERVIVNDNRPPDASRYNETIRQFQDDITRMTVRIRTTLEQRDVN
ncbi:hypothetical protein Mal4_08240 [Maioricimonas rarisocia]|uniref:Uncharacterized protein n=2 Tax=Maioricimonas rarisocia TaxID=2528026 RepID=A0A517Z239_9PLAN|nr:hypothetical protein Mal4_08240 [Maioricimonas rarisocia]